MPIQTGGILIKSEYTPESAFNYFIINSTCEIVSYRTRGGILFKLTLHDGIETPYSSSRSNCPNQDIREVLLKLSFVNEQNEHFTLRSTTNEIIDFEIELNRCNEREFKNEVRVQSDIFIRSLDQFLEPICPSVIFAKIEEKIDTIEQLFRNTSKPNPAHDLLSLIIESNPYEHQFKIGIIMMESLTGFFNLNSYNVDVDDASAELYNLYKNLARYELWRLYELGYIHGDANQANFMVNPEYEYIKGKPGRVIIIDFGTIMMIKPSSSPSSSSSEIRSNICMITYLKTIAYCNTLFENRRKLRERQHDELSESQQLADTQYETDIEKIDNEIADFEDDNSYMWLNMRGYELKRYLDEIHDLRLLSKAEFQKHVDEGTVNNSNLHSGVVFQYPEGADPGLFPHITANAEKIAGVELEKTSHLDETIEFPIISRVDDGGPETTSVKSANMGTGQKRNITKQTKKKQLKYGGHSNIYSNNNFIPIHNPSSLFQLKSGFSGYKSSHNNDEVVIHEKPRNKLDSKHIWNKLDSNHIFTPEFIKSYIINEQMNLFIPNNLTPSKPKKNKTKTKTKKNKTKKNKTKTKPKPK